MDGVVGSLEPVSTRSVATVISRRLATESGARFSLVTFTPVGVGLLPLQLAAAYIGLRATGAIA